MELVEFFNLFYKIKVSSNQVIKRSIEHLYGLACGIQAMETGNFSVLSKINIANESDFLYWFDGVIEAIVLMNGNGDMAKTADRVVNEILAHSPLCKDINMLIERMYSYTNHHLLLDHFETFFLFYRELLSQHHKAKSLPTIAKAVFIFIENDKEIKRISFFNEMVMPLVLQFDQDFINSLGYFEPLLGSLGHARPAVKYLVHIAKSMDRRKRKMIVAYINMIDSARKFIRVRGVRRVLKQTYGNKISGFRLFKHEKWLALNKKQQILFEKPCKMVGRFQNKAILELESKQYLFMIDEEKEVIFWSSIKKKVKPEGIDAFFANDMI